MSQLGYMFVAAGVGAYSVAMYHLFTHAFFKAMLFLGAGSVIHAMHHEQDMRHYGGPTIMTHILLMVHCVNNRTGTKKQHRFEKGMRKQVIHSYRIGTDTGSNKHIS